MSTLVNYLGGKGTLKNTGTLGNEVPTGVPTGVITVPKTWRLDPSGNETFNQAYIKSQIKLLDFTAYLSAIGYENQDEAAEIFTTQTKVKIKSINGKPGFDLDFSKGYHFNAAAYQRNSFDAVDVLFVYDNGSIFAAKDFDGKIKGHTAGMQDTMNFKHANGSDPQKTTIVWQLINPEEYNTDGVILTPDANGFNLQTIKAPVDCLLEKGAVAATIGKLSIVSAGNTSIPIKGVAPANLRATGTAATIDAVSYNESTKDYDVTFSADVSAEWDSMILEFFDSGDTTSVVEIGNLLYIGKSEA